MARFEHLNLSNTRATNNINTGCGPLRCAGARALILYMLAHWHGLLARLNGTEPSLMLLVTPVLFPTSQNVRCEKVYF